MNSMNMKVPSGRTFFPSDIYLMRAAAQTGFVKWYDEIRTLASGRKSHIYVEGRADTTENPAFLQLACRKILQDTKLIMGEESDNRRPRFIGIPHVAHGWTPALTIVDYYESITGRSSCHAIMRSEPKEHGGRKGKWLAGTYAPTVYRDILFDNVVTDSGSKEKAVQCMVDDGWDIQGLDAVVFVDRQQGGFEKMKNMGFRRVHANYLLLDMTYCFQQIGAWRSDAVERVEKEIRENQVVL